MDKAINVLMVDDETDFLEPVAFWLKSKGYAVTTLTTGAEAVELVKQALQDVICLDINMPGMDGIETLRRIRALSRDLPVVMVTAAYQDEKNISRASTLGISGFFPKNNSLSELVRVIETCLRMHTKLKAPPTP